MEIIVVIAIIAIMSGVAILAINPAGQKYEEARQYAKSFYYSAQESITDLKLDVDRGIVDKSSAAVTVDVPSGQKRLLALHVSAGGALLSLQYADGADSNGLRSATLTTVASTDTNWSGVYTSLEKVVSACEKDSWYFAVIDDHYRVESTFWTEKAYSELQSASFAFTGDSVVSGSIVGAYPVEACASGKKMFG